MDHFTFPNTDSPEVMQAAVSAWITSLIWKQVSRGVHDDDAEEMLVGVYARIYKAVKTAHDGG